MVPCAPNRLLARFAKSALILANTLKEETLLTAGILSSEWLWYMLSQKRAICLRTALYWLPQGPHILMRCLTFFSRWLFGRRFSFTRSTETYQLLVKIARYKIQYAFWILVQNQRVLWHIVLLLIHKLSCCINMCIKLNRVLGKFEER